MSKKITPAEIRAYNSDLGVACAAPEAVFYPQYDDIPENIRRIIEQAGGIPCEGGGVPTNGCKFGSKFGGCPFYASERDLEENGIDFEDLDTERDYAEDIR